MCPVEKPLLPVDSLDRDSVPELLTHAVGEITSNSGSAQSLRAVGSNLTASSSDSGVCRICQLTEKETGKGSKTY